MQRRQAHLDDAFALFDARRIATEQAWRDVELVLVAAEVAHDPTRVGVPEQTRAVNAAICLS